MAASDAVLSAIGRNAVRHLLEADDHFKNRRYASALASAVFSIEESGKLGFVRASGRNQTNHKIKQIPYILMVHLTHSFGWAMQWQRILKEGLDPQSPLTEQQEQSMLEHPEFAEFVGRLRAGELTDAKDRLEAYSKALAAKEKRDGTFDRVLPLYEGELHKLRMQATYVDFDKNGNLVADPSSITAEQAEDICVGAFLFLALSIGLFLPAHMKEVKDDFAKSIPDDLTGYQRLTDLSDALNKLMKKGK